MRYLFVLLLVSGCAVDLELAERNRAAYGPECERLGLLSGTEGYGDCVMWRSMVDEQQRKARSAGR
jgi:hypothetical protein